MFYSIHSWWKLIKMKTVEKPKCRLKRPTLNSLITLGQLWFSISKIQWKLMKHLPPSPPKNSTFFFKPFRMKWSSYHLKRKTSSWIHWWLLGVVADCEAISTSTPHRRATKRDKMAYGKDLTVQIGFLSGFWTDNLCFLLIFFMIYMKFSLRENTVSTSQASLQYCLFSTLHLERCLCYSWLVGTSY